MAQRITYKVTFHEGANRGSFAVDAIASAVNGEWHDATDDVAFIEVAEFLATSLEGVLEADVRVAAYVEV